MRLSALFIVLFILFGCGPQTQVEQVDISMTTLVWQGSIDADPLMLKVFDDTMSCLSLYGYSRTDYPYVYIVEDSFNCGPATNVNGCEADGKFIFIQRNFSYNSTLAGSQDAPSSLLQHEIIHWATGKDDEYRDQPFFSECQIPIFY